MSGENTGQIQNFQIENDKLKKEMAELVHEKEQLKREIIELRKSVEELTRIGKILVDRTL